MREETLKNLVHVVDKLDEKHLQDKLVRCISSLQGDAEASIRTNVTIFLGKIAPKLKESTRARILCASFQKAMRDNFMHCR
jgi:SCY1-like protein 1